MQISKLQHAQVAGNDNGEVMSNPNKRCCRSLIKKVTMSILTMYKL
jgi:hypothetical protein